MQNYVIIENDFFKLALPDVLREYGDEVIRYSTDKLKEYFDFFKVEDYGEKIKVSMFLDREKFLNWIHQLVPTAIPPTFCQGGVLWRSNSTFT